MPKGQVHLPISLIGQPQGSFANRMVNFLVVQSAVPYYGIMGRPTIHSF